MYGEERAIATKLAHTRYDIIAQGMGQEAHISAAALFAAMDSALEHRFAFNEAVSLLIPCETQEEIDHFWSALSWNTRKPPAISWSSNC